MSGQGRTMVATSRGRSVAAPVRFEELVVPAVEPARGEVAAEAARRLAADELLVHPTSTLYGLGARATPALDAELARLKGRPVGLPLIRLAADSETVRRSVPAAVWSERAERLAAAFWPGALTLVLQDGTEHGLAVRVDAHPMIRAVLEALGELMSSTSVNRSGEPAATGPERVRHALERLPSQPRRTTFLNAGPLPGVEPSTLVSLRGPTPRVLRRGAVPVERIAGCLGEDLSGGS